MKPSDHRLDADSELSSYVAAGCCLLAAALSAALLLAARSTPAEHEPGAVLAYGPPPLSSGAGARLAMLWEVTGRSFSAAAVWDVDQNGDDELLLLEHDDMIVIFDAQGRFRRSVALPHDAGFLDVARRRRPPALILGSLYATVGAYERSGLPLWTYSLPMTHDLAACMVADLDGDGPEEIIAAQSDRGLSCLDANGRLRWELPLPGLIASLATGDIDADGLREIIVSGHDTPVYVVTNSGHLRATWDLWASATHVAAADLDGEGTAEVALQTATFDEPEKAFVAGVDPSGRIMWQRSVPNLVRAVDRALVAVDADGDGRREWAAAGSDGSLHFISKDGTLLGVYSADEPLIGVYSMRTRGAEGQRLIAVSPTAARCLEPKGGAAR